MIGQLLRDNGVAIAYPETAAKDFSASSRGNFGRRYRAALRHSRYVRLLRVGVLAGIAVLLLTLVGINYMPPIGGFRLPGELGKLVILHDIERWKGHPVVKEVEGMRIVKLG